MFFTYIVSEWKKIKKNVDLLKSLCYIREARCEKMCKKVFLFISSVSLLQWNKIRNIYTKIKKIIFLKKGIDLLKTLWYIKVARCKNV